MTIKRFVKYISVVAVIAISAMSIGFAEVIFNYEQEAGILKEMNIFRGDGDNLMLEKTPTRNEAAVMIVRLLGKEKEALEKKYEHPFQDVPEWASPYVGYMYQNKLTSGKSETEFGGSDPLSVRQYSIFMMRVLDYTDNVDFTWNNAAESAKGFGVIDGASYDGLMAKESFLRDDLAGITYWTLNAYVKNQGKRLYDVLVSNGAISEDISLEISKTSTNEPVLKKIVYNGDNDKLSNDLADAMGYYPNTLEITYNRDFAQQFKEVLWACVVEADETVIEKYYLLNYFEAYNAETFVDGENLRVELEMKYHASKEDFLAKKNGEIPVVLYKGETYKGEFISELQKVLVRGDEKVVVSYPGFKTADINKELYKYFALASEALENDYDVSGVFGGATYYDLKREYTQYNVKYNISKEIIDERLKRYPLLVEKVNKVVDEMIRPGMTEYQMEKILHDYLVKNVVYDIENANNNTLTDETHSAIGALLNGTAVCDGYAKAMKMLLNKVGIECEVISGDTKDSDDDVGHAWNIVKIDGQNYHLDPTWADPVGAKYGSDYVSYEYFNVPDDLIGQTHIWEGDFGCDSDASSYYKVEGFWAGNYEEFKDKVNYFIYRRASGFKLYVKDCDQLTKAMIEEAVTASQTVRTCSYSVDTNSKVVEITDIEY